LISQLTGGTTAKFRNKIREISNVSELPSGVLKSSLHISHVHKSEHYVYIAPTRVPAGSAPAGRKSYFGLSGLLGTPAGDFEGEIE